MSNIEEKKNENKWVNFNDTTSKLDKYDFMRYLSPNFVTPLSKKVLLISDPKYVSKHTSTYLYTTLQVSGHKVTKCDDINSEPLFWVKNDTHNNDNNNNNVNEWTYILKLKEYHCVLIPSQINESIYEYLKDNVKESLRDFIKNGGVLICLHFNGTKIINGLIPDTNWHEISLRVGVSLGNRKLLETNKLSIKTLKYEDDIRGIVGVKNGKNNENGIYYSNDDIITVANKK